MGLKSAISLALLVLLSPVAPSQQGNPPAREIVVCGWDEVFILDLNDRQTDAPRKIWSWRAKERRDLPDDFKSLFDSTDECKPFDAGRKILITSSGGAVALVDRAQDRVIFHVQAEGQSWWAERIRFLNPPDTLHVPGEHFYKARWNVRR